MDQVCSIVQPIKQTNHDVANDSSSCAITNGQQQTQNHRRTVAIGYTRKTL